MSRMKLAPSADLMTFALRERQVVDSRSEGRSIQVNDYIKCSCGCGIVGVVLAAISERLEGHGEPEPVIVIEVLAYKIGTQFSSMEALPNGVRLYRIPGRYPIRIEKEEATLLQLKYPKPK